MQRPCDDCKRERCPEICCPLKDYERNIRKNPCRKCQDRTPGCHSTCERFALWKAEHDKKTELIRDNRNKDREAERFIIKGKMDARQALQKRGERRK